MRLIATLLFVFLLAGCTAFDQQPTPEQLAYEKWYRHLTMEQRHAEDRRELARIRAAGMILQGIALRGGPLGDYDTPYRAFPVAPFAPLPFAPFPRQPASCSAVDLGVYSYIDCY